MKAFLLAGGHGVRLRPITDTIPKCLVPIQGVPLLSIWLQLCKRIGIDEVLINVHAHAKTVCEFLERDSHRIAVRVVAELQLLGSAGTGAESNVIRIGTQGTQTATYIAGISGTVVVGSDVTVAASGAQVAARHR